MKPALIAAFCAAAFVHYAPSDAAARTRTAESPPYALAATSFKKLPKDAQEALLDYRKQERSQPYRCYGLSEKRFRQAVGPLAVTDYNGDGVWDYLFNSPCRPRTLPAGADILLSNPLGYRVAEGFDAFVGVVNGQPALLVEAACDETWPGAGDGRACYLGRIWDRGTGHWAGAKRVRLAADGSGFIVAPLEPPRPATTPPPVVVSPPQPLPPAVAPAPPPSDSPSSPAKANHAPQAAPKPAPAQTAEPSHAS